MKEFPLKIVTPTGSAFDGPALRLSLRGASGDLAVMAGHIPFATTVQAGDCRVILPDGSVRSSRCGPGILTVGADLVTFVTDSFL